MSNDLQASPLDSCIRTVHRTQKAMNHVMELAGEPNTHHLYVAMSDTYVTEDEHRQRYNHDYTDYYFDLQKHQKMLGFILEHAQNAKGQTGIEQYDCAFAALDAAGRSRDTMLALGIGVVPLLRHVDHISPELFDTNDEHFSRWLKKRLEETGANFINPVSTRLSYLTEMYNEKHQAMINQLMLTTQTLGESLDPLGQLKKKVVDFCYVANNACDATAEFGIDLGIYELEKINASKAKKDENTAKIKTWQETVKLELYHFKNAAMVCTSEEELHDLYAAEIGSIFQLKEEFNTHYPDERFTDRTYYLMAQGVNNARLNEEFSKYCHAIDALDTALMELVTLSPHIRNNTGYRKGKPPEPEQPWQPTF